VIIKKKLAISIVAVAFVVGGSNIGFSSDDCFEDNKERDWCDKFNVAFMDAGGNSDTQSLSISNLMQYKLATKLKLSWTLSGTKGESNGDLSAENYETTVQAKYAPSARYYFFDFGLEKDEFRGIDRNISVGPGIGFQIFNGYALKLSTEASINYDLEKGTDGSREDVAKGILKADYSYLFSKRYKFSETLEYERELNDSNKYAITSETQLSSKMSETMAMNLTYTLKYDSEPISIAYKKLDRTLTVGVEKIF
jgi:putative salt-induced outer membrane protein YdiY